jgi:hypothetical protein
MPGAFEGGELALHAGEEFGGGGIGKECGGEGSAGGFGEDGAVEIGLDALEAARLPIGAEHGIHVEDFGIHSRQPLPPEGMFCNERRTTSMGA